LREKECACVCERERVGEFVCVWCRGGERSGEVKGEGEREGEKLLVYERVCMCERGREFVCMCKRDKERVERDSLCACEGESVCVCVRDG
jgi:hypothetical protein